MLLAELGSQTARVGHVLAKRLLLPLELGDLNINTVHPLGLAAHSPGFDLAAGEHPYPMPESMSQPHLAFVIRQLTRIVAREKLLRAHQVQRVRALVPELHGYGLQLR